MKLVDEVNESTVEKQFIGDYSPIVKQIENLPRKTKEDRAKVKEEIAKVRAGIQREKGILSQTRTKIESAIVNNPKATKEEVLHNLNIEQFPLTIRAVITATVEDYFEDRKNTKKILSFLREKATEDRSEAPISKKMGKRLYEMVAHRKPANECEVKESAFGVWLFVEDKADFMALGVDNVVSGFYKDEQISQGLGFPLIVTTKFGTKSDVTHEEAHSQHADIRTGLWLAKNNYQEKYWGKSEFTEYKFFRPKVYAELSKLASLTKIFGKQAEHLRAKAIVQFRLETQNMIEHCQTLAKDELLAEFYNPEGTLNNHLYFLKLENKVDTSDKGKLAQVSENEEGKETTENIAQYDYLTRFGLQKLKTHWLFGKMAQEVRLNYNQSLDQAVKSLIELIHGWEQTGIDPDKLRRRFIYGHLISERLSSWARYIDREFGKEIKLLDNLTRAQQEISSVRHSLQEWIKESSALGFFQAAQMAANEDIRLEEVSQSPIEIVKAKIKEGNGEIAQDVLEAALKKTEIILPNDKDNLEKIDREKAKLEAEVAAKMNQTVTVKTAEALNQNESYLRGTQAKVDSLWNEQLVFTQKFSDELGIPIFEGVWKLDNTGDIPTSIKVTVGDLWKKEEKTFDFSSEKVREIVQDIHDMRTSLNRVSRLTGINHDLRQKIEKLSEHFYRTINNSAYYPSVFQKFQALSAPLSKETVSQIAEINEEIRKVKEECAREFEKVTNILGKYNRV